MPSTARSVLVADDVGNVVWRVTAIRRGPRVPGNALFSASVGGVTNGSAATHVIGPVPAAMRKLTHLRVECVGPAASKYSPPKKSAGTLLRSGVPSGKSPGTSVAICDPRAETAPHTEASREPWAGSPIDVSSTCVVMTLIVSSKSFSNRIRELAALRGTRIHAEAWRNRVRASSSISSGDFPGHTI